MSLRVTWAPRQWCSFGRSTVAAHRRASTIFGKQQEAMPTRQSSCCTKPPLPTCNVCWRCVHGKPNACSVQQPAGHDSGQARGKRHDQGCRACIASKVVHGGGFGKCTAAWHARQGATRGPGLHIRVAAPHNHTCIAKLLHAIPMGFTKSVAHHTARTQAAAPFSGPAYRHTAVQRLHGLLFGESGAVD